MKGHGLARRRRDLGVSLDELSAHVDLSPATIEQWESLDLHIPSQEAAALNAALWLIECRQIADRSGISPCEWARFNQDTAELEEIHEHLRSCAQCRARDDYVQRHAPRMPGVTGWAGGVLRRVYALPGPITGAVSGALMVLVFTAMPILGLLGSGVVRRELEPIAYAAALLVFSVCSGATGGFVYGITRSMRERGTIGHYTSWILALIAYIAAAFGLLVGAEVYGPFAQENGEMGAMVRNPALLAIMLACSVVLGIVIGRAARRAENEPLGAPPPGRSRAQTVAIVLIVLGGTASIGLQWWSGRVEQENIGMASLSPEQATSRLDSLEATAVAYPEDPAALYALGMALASLQRHTDAVVPLQQAVTLVPRNASFHNAHGWSLMQLERDHEATRAFEHAVEINPDYRIAWVNLGWARAYMGQFDAAATAFEHAMTLDPTDDEAHVLLGRALVDAGRFGEGYQAAVAAIERDSTKARHHEIAARALLGLARLDEAFAMYRKSARLAPDEPRYWRELARLAHMMGNFAAADSAFARVDSLVPEHFANNAEDRAMWEEARGKVF